MRFDPVDEPWIAVVTRNGRELVSLRTALTEAHRLLGLALDAPLEAVAVFRQMLLPVYLDAVFRDAGCRYPTSTLEWGQLWQAEALDGRPPWADAASPSGPIDVYLSRHRERFQAFGARPFAQVADLRTGKDETKPVSLLIAAAASGNNVPLFSTRTNDNPPALSAGAALRAVLATHCWDTAGIKSGAYGDPAAKSGKTTGNLTGALGGVSCSRWVRRWRRRCCCMYRSLRHVTRQTIRSGWLGMRMTRPTRRRGSNGPHADCLIC